MMPLGRGGGGQCRSGADTRRPRRWHAFPEKDGGLNWQRTIEVALDRDTPVVCPTTLCQDACRKKEPAVGKLNVLEVGS